MRYFIILVYSDYYVSMYYSLKERVKNEVRRPLDSSFFTRSWVLDDGAALCDSGRAIFQYIIRYFLTFSVEISNLVSITCYMRYLDVVIYEIICIKRYIKFSILQLRVCQIDTKCPEKCKKV